MRAAVLRNMVVVNEKRHEPLEPQVGNVLERVLRSPFISLAVTIALMAHAFRWYAEPSRRIWQFWLTAGAVYGLWFLIFSIQPRAAQHGNRDSRPYCCPSDRTRFWSSSSESS